MATNTQHAGNEIQAGFYPRVLKEIRSLGRGWSKKKSINLPEAEMDRPWAGLAEWLRVAHSLLDDKTVELTPNAD
jgi:hypothetical protein